MFRLLQVWFQNRRAKFRKKENTKKGPGRPAHNAHPQTCSGEPISAEELLRKERDRREKKLVKQLEKQQKKLAAKGIHVEMDALRADYENQKAGGGGKTAHLDAQKLDEEIDVVGMDDKDDDDTESNCESNNNTPALRTLLGLGSKTPESTPLLMQTTTPTHESVLRRKITPFSIESLLNCREEEEHIKLQQKQQQRRQMECFERPDDHDDDDMLEDASAGNASFASEEAAATHQPQSSPGWASSSSPARPSSPFSHMSEARSPPSSPPSMMMPRPALSATIEQISGILQQAAAASEASADEAAQHSQS